MAFLELINISKSYSVGTNKLSVLKNINLNINEGEFVAILGFSGSGKTTLISLIAGLITADEGEILLKGKNITAPGTDRGIIFQNYSLLPWLDVYGNIRLAVDKVFIDCSAAEKDKHVRKFIDLVKLTKAVKKFPSELSGGMRQRVAVARALAMNPSILLMDEPLGALDALTRGSLQNEIAKIWQQEKKTVVMITNDVDESLLLADRVIILNPGPDATLGKEFKIYLPRPRDRQKINYDVDYKKIRREIMDSLLSLKQKEQVLKEDEEIFLPSLEPEEAYC